MTFQRTNIPDSMQEHARRAAGSVRGNRDAKNGLTVGFGECIFGSVQCTEVPISGQISTSG